MKLVTQSAPFFKPAQAREWRARIQLSFDSACVSYWCQSEVEACVDLKNELELSNLPHDQLTEATTLIDAHMSELLDTP